MLLFLLSLSLSLIFLCANLPPDMRFHPLSWKGKDFAFFLNQITLLFPTMFPRKKPQILPQEKPLLIQMPSSPSLLDLPDLVLECILHKLPPEALCRMAAACTSLRDMCAADHLWERHLHHKWWRIFGPNARREWRIHAAFGRGKGQAKGTIGGEGGLADYLIRLWPLALIRSGFSCDNHTGKRNFSPADSVMSWYLALETGSFWFPAQVYNRENGHVGFVLSCYDAELSYDRRTNTFQARYPPHGRRICAIESGVTWDRLRAPPVNTSPHDLHISDCLDELQPGDPIEIQWRRNREFPYGWWYGVVGHLETCDGNTYYCRCSDKDTLVLEFNQYTRGSRWRTTTVNRKDHREEGNEADGFYGGIRKLSGNEEVSMWEKLWPSQALE